jgi:hypothetical protein
VGAACRFKWFQFRVQLGLWRVHVERFVDTVLDPPTG